MREEEKFNKKLLVEGNDDQHVIWALCEKFSITQNFDVIDSMGINNLLLQIPVRLKQSEINALGIIIDADVEIKNRWTSLTTLLASIGFALPNEIPTTGYIAQANNLKIGIWIMPNNALNGMLEDFISFLIPKDDLLIQNANQILEDIENKNLNKYQIIHRPKALIHTWLAWQEGPGTPMGLAITKKYLTTDELICSHLMKWITQTFS